MSEYLEERVAKWREAFEEEKEAIAVTLPAPWPLIRDLYNELAMYRRLDASRKEVKSKSN